MVSPPNLADGVEDFVGLAIVLVLRLTLPLAVLRWRLAGALIAIAADAVDIIIFQATDFPPRGYHQFDKLLDLYYLSLFAIAARAFEPAPRMVGWSLFGYRVIGVVAFEISGIRALLLVFPNVFEFFYLFNAARLRYNPSYEMTLRRCTAWTGILLVPKMAQEYALHYAEWLDQWSALEIIKSTIRRIVPG